MPTRARTIKRPAVSAEHAGRLPPGQIAAKRWPVLHVGPIPSYDLEPWDVRIGGLVARPRRFTWPEFATLPTVSLSGDLHCVTRWSQLDNTWEGVAAQAIVRLVEPLPAARFVIVRGEGGYSANLPLAAFAAEDVLLAFRHNGEPLTPAHGFPVRLVVPRRYAWKSVKWLRAIDFVAENVPGFWESYGYHDEADPWREERFAQPPPPPSEPRA